MTTDGALELIRNAIFIVAQLAGPAILAAVVFGVAIGILQTVTQVNEQSVSFIVKLLAVCAIFALVGSHMITKSVEYTRRTIGSISEVMR